MIIVWSKPMCPQCQQAKALLKSKGTEYEERVIGEGWSKEQLLEVAPAARSVPQIVIDEKVIGGYNELRKYFGL
jgi:glutaredoxin 3